MAATGVYVMSSGGRIIDRIGRIHKTREQKGAADKHGRLI
jgi:hypothetical protein